ncbi:PAS domain S-box protein [Oceanidesulfovibrio marinus]|uniref:histidine kinase n=2 Tax=Oceanidesulfovibrio marinus TaxID=370038 RepID=A0ABX6NFM8_9BACT|nr:PAS domain S-box protein [Oceanidesulfovibrio marinus]
MADFPNTPDSSARRSSAGALDGSGRSPMGGDSCPSLLRALLDHIPALAYAKDEEHRWVYFNAFFLSTFGLPAEALLGAVDLEILPPDIAAWVRSQDVSVLSSGRPLSSETEVVWNGAPCNISSSKSCWTDPVSGKRYVLGFIKDITWRKRTEREQVMTMAIAENGPAVLIRCLATPGLPIDYASANTRRFGYDPRQLIEQNTRFESLIHEEDLPRVVRESGRNIGEGNDHFVLEYRLRTWDGEPRWVEDHVFIERDGQGAPQYRQGFILDVTRQHDALQDREASETRYRTLAQNFPDGSVVMFDDELRFTLAEGKALMRDGPEHMEGNTLWDVFSPETAEYLATRYRAALRGRKSLFEMPYGDRLFEVRVVPVRNVDGVITGGMAVSHDITRRKEAETALAELNANLEKLVTNRTRTLARQAQDLEEANRQLKKLDELKSSFLSSVSHELRTPLTSIFGFTKLINKDMENGLRALVQESRDQKAVKRFDRILDNLGIIEQEGARLTRLINDVLDLTRIESGRMEWRDARISIADCIYEAVLAVSGQFVEKESLRLEADVPKDLPEIFADPDRIVQVIVNLLGNAAKFTSQGVVRIRARRVDDDIAVFVTDTGAGIQPSELGRIFDKFHQTQLGDTICQASPGSGLGLSICKDIVERYKGRIWVRSAAGSGSVFTFTLPIAPQKEATAM